MSLMEYPTDEKSLLENELAALRREVHRLKAALQRTQPDKLIWWLDSSGKIVRVNDEVERLFELYTPEGQRRNLLQLVTQATQETFAQSLDETNTMGFSSGQLELTDRRGQVRTLAFSTTLEAHEHNGLPPYVQLQAHEIPILNERQHHDHNMDIPRIVFNTSSAAILITDRDGCVIDANRSAALYFSAKVNQLIGATLGEIFDRTGISLPSIATIGREITSKGEYKYPVRGTNQSGRYTMQEVVFKRGIYYGQEAFAVFTKDITREYEDADFLMTKFYEIKVIKETMRHVSARMYTAESAVVKAIDKLQELGYIHTAGAYRIAEHRKKAELYFKNNFPPELNDRLSSISLKEFEKVFVEKQTYEYPIGTFGVEQTVPMLFVPVIVENKVAAAMMFLLDSGRPNDRLILTLIGTELGSYLTQSRLVIQKDQAEKSLAFRKMFLANMSHEIRTPMNGIVGMIDLLKDTPLNDEQAEHVDTIKTASEALLNIVNDILDLSKIEAGKMELYKTPTSLKEIVHQIRALFKRQLLERDLEFFEEISSGIPPCIVADADRLMQILSNLFSNAVKFTTRGRVGIKAYILATQEPQITVRIEVHDTGSGIPPEQKSRLFQNFSQIENTYNRTRSSSGLGLAIAQELCKLMGGNIGVVSEVGKGSVFWFTFQTEAGRPDDLPSKNNTDDTQQFPSVEGNPNILVVDDNALNLKVARTILSKCGCQVTTASSGFKALEMMNLTTFDLVFMDIQMPEMNGMETTAKIRDTHKHKRVPIVAMTAFSMQEERESFLAAGMDDYIAKPVKAQSLTEMVVKWTKLPNSTGSTPSATATPIVPSTDSLPIVRIETLNELLKYGGDIDFVRSIYEEFEQETVHNLAQYQQLFDQQNDLTTATRLMHSLKGTAGTVGAAQLSAQAAKVEKRGKDEGIFPTTYEWQDLLSAFESFRKNYLKALQMIEK
jgi:signal transduction histidine kinase/CheY-like chemotaxis protein/HPt (histidine-containing phosphotransfer) domain-containing protein/PAS domain-containing protein